MPFNLSPLQQKLTDKGSLVLNFRVRPGASKPVIKDQMEDGSLKVDVAAPPEGGLANNALCELLAETFNVPRTNVMLLKGQTSRVKTVRITNAL